MYQDICNCICQNTQKWRYTTHYVKPTAQLLFESRFLKGGPTCRRQVVNPRHQTPQGQSVAKPETPLQNIQVESDRSSLLKFVSINVTLRQSQYDLDTSNELKHLSTGWIRYPLFAAVTGIYPHLAPQYPLQWRHNGRDGVSNHLRLGCLLNRLFRCRSKKTSKIRVTGLCGGNSPVTGEFPSQRASIADNVSIWWRHHAMHGLRPPVVLWCCVWMHSCIGVSKHGATVRYYHTYL